MRHVLAVLALSLFAACGGDDSTKTYDLSTKLDQSASQGDMAKSGCYALITCAAGCNGASACEQACLANGSTGGVSAFNALFACTYGVCLPSDAGDHDGGAGSCTSENDSSSACQACLTAASEGGACSSQLTACEAAM